MELAELRASPNALADHYTYFRVSERLLLTGHSHQAWPDRALEGQVEAFDDAAEHIDAKWERAFAKAERLRRGLAELLDDPVGGYAFGASTHELVLRFLSALPLGERPRLVTTDGEFHTLRRQLARLEEAGLEVVRVAAAPAATVGERLAAAVDDRTAAVLVSAVFFATAEIAGGLGALPTACEKHGAELLLDAYHAAGVAPFAVVRDGLEAAFVVGGGYKYLQMGEGCCYLRVPAGRNLRPVITGWFAEFEDLAQAGPTSVPYPSGAAAFAGSTYDPTSHYRACSVLDFWAEQGLNAPFLRRVSQHQVGLLRRRFDDLDLPARLVSRDREQLLERTAGFLALRSPRAGELCAALGERGVASDFRGDFLRLGPAPYLADHQLETAIDLLGEAARGLL